MLFSLSVAFIVPRIIQALHFAPRIVCVLIKASKNRKPNTPKTQPNQIIIINYISCAYSWSNLFFSLSLFVLLLFWFSFLSSSFVCMSFVQTRPTLLGSCNCDELKPIQCHLETKDLWEKFHDLGTEMIITKTGRYVYIESIHSTTTSYVSHT